VILKLKIYNLGIFLFESYLKENNPIFNFIILIKRTMKGKLLLLLTISLLGIIATIRRGSDFSQNLRLHQTRLLDAKLVEKTCKGKADPTKKLPVNQTASAVKMTGDQFSLLSTIIRGKDTGFKDLI